MILVQQRNLLKLKEISGKIHDDNARSVTIKPNRAKNLLEEVSIFDHVDRDEITVRLVSHLKEFKQVFYFLFF